MSIPSTTVNAKHNICTIYNGKELDEWVQELHINGAKTTIWKSIPLRKYTYLYDDLCIMVVSFFNMWPNSDTILMEYMGEQLINNYMYWKNNQPFKRLINGQYKNICRPITVRASPEHIAISLTKDQKYMIGFIIDYLKRNIAV